MKLWILSVSHVTVADALGEPVRIPEAKHLATRLSPVDIERISRYTRRLSARVLICLWIWLALGVVSFAIACFAPISRPALGWTAGAFCVANLIVAMRWLDGYSIRWFGRALLAADRCPACGYDLANLVPSQVGVIVCPECGSAWDKSKPF